MADRRHVDLMQQGFMKSRKVRRKVAPKAKPPLVACDKCQDWHRKGKHLTKEFLAERRAREAKRNATNQE